ncbi:MAG TPA: hypothetical protein VGH48_05780 [Caldimonas sp.]
MPTESLAHAALSAAAVGVLLTTLRRAGPRAGGLAAAVPINSIPVLFWLSLEHGGAYATSAVLGTLWGTGLTVLLGATFARLASALTAARAALVAWLAIALLATLTWELPTMPATAAVLAMCAVVFGRAAFPRLTSSAANRHAGKHDATLLSMATAGAMALLVSELSRHSGPQFCGLVAAIPLVGTFATYAGYRQGGTSLMLRVLGGYLDGMAAKAAFLAALGAAWALGAGSWAWWIALAAAAVALLAQQRLQRRESRPPCVAGSVFDIGGVR